MWETLPSPHICKEMEFVVPLGFDSPVGAVPMVAGRLITSFSSHDDPPCWSFFVLLPPYGWETAKKFIFLFFDLETKPSQNLWWVLVNGVLATKAQRRINTKR